MQLKKYYLGEAVQVCALAESPCRQSVCEVVSPWVCPVPSGHGCNQTVPCPGVDGWQSNVDGWQSWGAGAAPAAGHTPSATMHVPSQPQGSNTPNTHTHTRPRARAHTHAFAHTHTRTRARPAQDNWFVLSALLKDQFGVVMAESSAAAATPLAVEAQGPMSLALVRGAAPGCRVLLHCCTAAEPGHGA